MYMITYFSRGGLCIVHILCPCQALLSFTAHGGDVAGSVTHPMYLKACFSTTCRAYQHANVKKANSYIPHK